MSKWSASISGYHVAPYATWASDGVALILMVLTWLCVLAPDTLTKELETRLLLRMSSGETAHGHEGYAVYAAC